MAATCTQNIPIFQQELANLLHHQYSNSCLITKELS
uniref:Uncharacterized protein n=1 Tax=Anguilla anguilla TaxID=7936 RepID=A0A0E9SG17_ANGAN